MTKETKSLSQQICELCGMKPRIRSQHDCPDTNCRSINGVSFCAKCAWCNEPIYPNFENPENFVKLYELMVDEKLNLTSYIVIILTHLDCLLHIPFDRKSYLQVLLSILQEKNIQQKWTDKIKQSIRDYDGWVWG